MIFNISCNSDSKMGRQFVCLLVSSLFFLGIAHSAYSQTNKTSPAKVEVEAKDAQIYLELNKLEALGKGCKLTFLLENEGNINVNKFALEFAFLDSKGQLSKLGSLNFGALVSNHKKISQFTLSDLSCDKISSMFINSETACDSAAKNSCLNNLRTSNKTKIGF